MKLKFLAFACAALAVFSGFAMLGQYAPRFYFATFGNDCYADGEPAMDGECYALVWQRNSVDFKGFNATGTIGIGEGTTLPVDPANCRVIAVFPTAVKEWFEADPDSGILEDGWISYCPGAHVAVDRDFYLNHSSDAEVEEERGTFSVYLFDTRKWTGGVAEVGGYDAANNRVPVLNGYGVVSFLETIDKVVSEPDSSYYKYTSQEDAFDYESALPSYGDVDAGFETFKDTFVSTLSAVPAEAQNLQIDLTLGENEVTVTAKDVPEYLRVDLSAANELADVGKTAVGKPQQGGKTLTWTIPREANVQQGFYKVIRQPLK